MSGLSSYLETGFQSNGQGNNKRGLWDICWNWLYTVINLLKLAGVLQNQLSLALCVAASLNNVEVKCIHNFARRGIKQERVKYKRHVMARRRQATYSKYPNQMSKSICSSLMMLMSLMFGFHRSLAGSWGSHLD